jgi:hypothetical protein
MSCSALRVFHGGTDVRWSMNERVPDRVVFRWRFKRALKCVEAQRLIFGRLNGIGRSESLCELHAMISYCCCWLLYVITVCSFCCQFSVDLHAKLMCKDPKLMQPNFHFCCKAMCTFGQNEVTRS